MKVHVRTTLYVLIFSAAVISPILGRDNAQLLIAVHVALLGYVILRPFPKRSLVYLYVGANVMALLLHLGDPASVLNAGSLIVSILAIAGVAYHCARVQDLDRTIEKALWACLIASAALSVVLTAIGWPTAPGHFPWQAFFSDERLLLLMGDVGHTPSLWVTAFLAAFVMHRRGSKTLLIALAVLLIATESRLAVVYLINLLVMAMAYRGFPVARRTVMSFARRAVMWTPVAFAVGFLALAVLPTSNSATLAAQQIQHGLGNLVRLTPDEESGATVFAGRDLLNRALFAASFEHPIRGLGDGSPILQYGVDAEGYIAYDPEQKKAASESVLRLAVKYGWPYFAAVAIFFMAIPAAFRRLPYRERILHTGIWGMCLESVAAEGGMEQFYGESGLFLFLMCAMYFHARLRPEGWSLASRSCK